MAEKDIKIVPKTKWKRLKVDTTSLDPEFLDGFLGIEELTDYDISADGLNSKKAKKERKPVIKKRKICFEEEETSLNNTETSENASVQPPPKKKKRKNKKKKIKPRYDCCAVEDVTAETAESLSEQPEVQVLTDASLRIDKPSENVDTQDENAACDTNDVSGWANCYVPEQVLTALSKLGFNSPTPIQEMTLPSAIRDRRDIVGAAETGSGKTLAFGIPIIHHILREKEEEKSAAVENGEEQDPEKLRCLIMTPTRELAIQIKNHLVAVTRFTDIKISVVVGGMAVEKQHRVLKRKPDIVIATPGRLWELIEEEEPHLTKVSTIRYLVVDEADRMLETGHFEELSRILALINSNKEAAAKRQTFVFSATLTFVHQMPVRFLNKKRKFKPDSVKKLSHLIRVIGTREKPKIVDITEKSGTAGTLTESRINCNQDEKDYYLYYLLMKYPGKTIVFCNSIDCVRRLNKLFAWLNLNLMPLHASMHQKQRLKNLERFSEKGNQLLLATDVAARGLDIPNIQHVIHYQVPRTSESYIHRSGRTARASKEGISILLIDPSEQNLYQKICRNLDKGLLDLPTFPVDMMALKETKLRVNTARKLDIMEHRMRKARTQNSWIQQAAESLELDLDDNDNVLNDLGSERKQAKEKREMNALKKYLTQLLKQQLVAKNYVTRYPTSMNKSLEEVFFKPAEKDETAIVAARKEKKHLDQLKGELKLMNQKQKSFLGIKKQKMKAKKKSNFKTQ
ncbi:ATP-dependent RNA helicase ddx24, variant 2 [Chamberlinius hualienensis]